MRPLPCTMSGTAVRKLSAHVVVYLLIALCLYPDDDYEEVAEKLTSMPASMPGARWEAPTRGAITQARQRLGFETVREVFRSQKDRLREAGR
ncbi:transposase domain-containing protein [Streptosporangium amethystogenes]|uniref:transposase domain-containing protein n=1 Tax=Streptosporangium amethystogenes TaxID=2002 RepID=UPI0037A47480